MVSLNFFKRVIPSYRHKKDIKILDNNFVYLKKFKNNSNNKKIKHIKRFVVQRISPITNIKTKLANCITYSSYYQIKPYKKLMLCKTVDNFNITIPGVEFLVPSKLIFHYSFINENINKFYFKGFNIPIYLIPLTVVFSNVNNTLNNKITYAKATGTYCKLKKQKKIKKKLICVILPSKTEVFLNKYSYAFIGKNTNLRSNSLVEGKWGFSFKTKKKITVRGVAMNPVDHPNGGRAKTVQPERSP